MAYFLDFYTLNENFAGGFMTDFNELFEGNWGVKYGDLMKITPYYGRAKSFQLKRTHYTFVPSKNIYIDYRAEGTTEVGLSGPLPLKGKYELRFIRDPQSKDCERGCYFLEAIGENFFHHNGNKVKSAFIDEGDKVRVGYNNISFVSRGGVDQRPLAEIAYKPAGLGPRVMASDINILLTGETGVGKSFLARNIHENSGKCGKFVQINLASFSHHLIESELFGHVKGAFTGAHKDKLGAIAEAKYGTLFIDEIDSLPLSLQTKILLFLDSKEFRRVGGRSEKSNARLIFAAGSSLEKLVDNKKFRKDLYFRITSGACFYLPPLRDSSKQVEKVVKNFALKKNISVSDSLIKYYQNLSWPGNIRQLVGHLEKKLIFTKGQKLFYDELDEELDGLNDINFFNSDNSLSPVYSLEELEKNYILKVYNRFNQNLTCTSKALGITPQTLRRKVRKLELSA